MIGIIICISVERVAPETHGGQRTPISAVGARGGRGYRQPGHGAVVRLQSFGTDVSRSRTGVQAKGNLYAVPEVRTKPNLK